MTDTGRWPSGWSTCDDRADAFRPRRPRRPIRIWGDNLEAEAVQQMKNACKLPVAVSGALMPDAHVGYGLPIGGVLATRDAVIRTRSASTSPAG